MWWFQFESAHSMLVCHMVGCGPSQLERPKNSMVWIGPLNPTEVQNDFMQSAATACEMNDASASFRATDDEVRQYSETLLAARGMWGMVGTKYDIDLDTVRACLSAGANLRVHGYVA